MVSITAVVRQVSLQLVGHMCRMCAAHSHHFKGSALEQYRSAQSFIRTNPAKNIVDQLYNYQGCRTSLDTNMCDWLSRGEWCDVKLLCGGHSFNAHRVVLASVSAFLRRILLSCPANETLTFIVLPDFDLEAMSSVLYYIYNGEVTLQKHKLGLFLDIIQAMQIYIDCQYLSQMKEAAEEDNFSTTCYDEKTLKTDIFTLCFEDDKNQKLINIKRGNEEHSVLLQYSQSETDFQDNTVKRQNGSELRKSRLGNLKSPYGDRQRNSFLRDLFIETYPRNGNVNGLTEGVLAISNECYHSPASMLSTNANGKHLSDDALTRFCTKTTQQSLNVSTIFHSGQQLKCTSNINDALQLQTRRKIHPYTNIPARDMTFIYGNRDTATVLSNEGLPLLRQSLTDQILLSELNTSLDLRHTVLEAMRCHLIENSQNSVIQSSLKFESRKKILDMKSTNSPKVIFNQVLENPWVPRIPNNYKPFRRKKEHSGTTNHKVEKIDSINDSNNNIQTSILTDEESIYERTLVEAKPSDEPASTINSSLCRDSFKCSDCDQVFTNSESLAVHMRRHSTNARYSCTECGKTFSQLRNFKYHMSIHRGTREFAATCTVCGKYFNDRGYLSSHMKIHRNRKEYKCSLCPKSFNQRVAYNMHVRIHTGVKPHVCEQCGKAFSRKMLLKQHQRTHSGERPYACPHCDKRFADRSNMTLHLRLHTGVKPFSCSLCPKSFTKKHHLKSHLNFHTGSKPYSCPRCKLAFTQSSNMRTHYKKCNAPDPGSGNDSQSNL